MSKSRADYDAYVKAYWKKTEVLSRKGLPMLEEIYSRKEFEANYEAERNTMKELVELGQRKVIGNITQNLVSAQAYNMSYKQGLTLMKGLKEAGLNTYLELEKGKFVEKQLNITQLRQKTIEAQQAYDYLGDMYHDLKNKGMTSEEAAHEISSTYFGS